MGSDHLLKISNLQVSGQTGIYLDHVWKSVSISASHITSGGNGIYARRGGNMLFRHAIMLHVL